MRAVEPRGHDEDGREERARSPALARLVAVGRWATRPVRRMWASDEEIEDYGLVHLASVAGDTLVVVALADSIFFSLPVGEAKLRVALYLALTMAPLAVAGPLLVPLLDRSRFRRAISFAASAGRALAAFAVAREVDSLLIFPATFAVLVLSKVHVIAKNGLTWSYAPSRRDLVRSNAFLGRVAVAGAVLGALPGLLLLKTSGAGAVAALAVVVYLVAALMNLRLPPAEVPAPAPESVTTRGRVEHLSVSAIGYGGLRAAQGFVLALFAFALRAAGRPASWYGVLAVAATVGAAVGDILAPRLPRVLREEVVVLGSLVGAGIVALFTFQAFSLPTLALFALLAGMATEFGRLAFQSLMQNAAPGGAQGRVFVRYEVVFQLAWTAGAFIPAMFPVPFRGGILIVGAFYLVLGLPFLLAPVLDRRAAEPREPE